MSISDRAEEDTVSPSRVRRGEIAFGRSSSAPKPRIPLARLSPPLPVDDKSVTSQVNAGERWVPRQRDSLPSLFLQVVLHGGDYADSLHKAAVNREIPDAGLAGVAAIIRGQNRENALICLPNGSDLAP